MASDLTRTKEKPGKEPGFACMSLHPNKAEADNWREYYNALHGSKATGIEKETKGWYARYLEANFHDLAFSETIG